MQVSNKTILVAIGVALAILALSADQTDACPTKSPNGSTTSSSASNTDKKESLKSLIELYDKAAEGAPKTKVLALIEEFIKKM